MTIRFDPRGAYEVEERDVPFARPAGMELQARIYRPKGEPAAPLAALVDAGVALAGEARDRDETARRALRVAAAGFDACGMAMHALAARHRLARLGGIGTAEDDALASFEERLAALGAAAPAKLVRLFIPV